jgi:2-oxoacid:acceptor oxidoreductase delta subunit (pyruvate/2-ketoisovalerate family)
LEEALDEGIILHWLTTIKQIDGTTFTVEKMEVDESGWPQPTGEFETLEADTLVLALGQAVDTSFLKSIPGVAITDDGVIDVDDTMMTGFAGLFAGGDMVPAERTVTVAVGHGKKAARNIDAWLRGEKHVPTVNTKLATYERLNSWYYTDAPKTVQPALALVRRQTSFDEIHGGLDETNALFEARRCLSCGNCFECDNCYGVCPDNAVIKLGPGNRFEFNYDFCKGCGVCAAECPCGAIDMVAESV